MLRNSTIDPNGTSNVSLDNRSSIMDSEMQRQSQLDNHSSPGKRRHKTLKRITSEMSAEMREEQRKQREKECFGSGFTNTEWLAAIDNTGQTLVLHTAESVKIIRKP